VPVSSSVDPVRIDTDMLALEIQINGKKVCTGGIEKLNILSAMVHWHISRDKLDLDVHGMTEEKGYAEHLRWLQQKLDIGDEVTIRVVDTDKPTKPKKRYRAK
jgi:hypothetical protein